ncbi:hypothetical protein D3C85_1724400 [compost metagenome]|jgi:hypothetical protein
MVIADSRLEVPGGLVKPKPSFVADEINETPARDGHFVSFYILLIGGDEHNLLGCE